MTTKEGGSRSRAGAEDPAWLRDILELRGRSKGGRLLLEGLRLNTGAREARVPFEQVLYAPEFYCDDACARLVGDLERGGVVSRRLAPETFSRVSYKAEGVLGVVRAPKPTLDEVLRAPRAIVLDGLSDPGNIGAILRTMNAWGAGWACAVVDGADKLYHPKALRASMGAIFHTPTCATDRAVAVAAVARLGRRVVVLSPDGTVGLDDLPLDGVVFVLGNERRGVHEAWRDVTTSRVAIPIGGAIDSLNVATAAAIILWEAFRREDRRRA